MKKIKQNGRRSIRILGDVGDHDTCSKTSATKESANSSLETEEVSHLDKSFSNDWSCDEDSRVVRIIGISSPAESAAHASCGESSSEGSNDERPETPMEKFTPKGPRLDTVNDESAWASSKSCWSQLSCIAPTPATTPRDRKVVKTFRPQTYPSEVRCITPLPPGAKRSTCITPLPGPEIGFSQFEPATTMSELPEEVDDDATFNHSMLLTEKEDMFALETTYPLTSADEEEKSAEAQERLSYETRQNNYASFEPKWGPLARSTSAEEKEADLHGKMADDDSDETVVSPQWVVLPHAPPPNGVSARRWNVQTSAKQSSGSATRPPIRPPASTKTTRIPPIHFPDPETTIRLFEDYPTCVTPTSTRVSTTIQRRAVSPLYSKPVENFGVRGHGSDTRKLFF